LVDKLVSGCGAAGVSGRRVCATIHNLENKTANISNKNCGLSIVLTATDQKPQKIIKKGDITQHHVDIQAM